MRTHSGFGPRSRLWRSCASFGVIAVLMTMVVSPAIAAEPIVDEVVFEFVYHDAEAELALLTGPALEEGCLGEGFDTQTRYSKLESDGTYSSHVEATGVRLSLFEGFSSGFDVIAASCQAVAMGLEPPQPVAIGVGSWKFVADNQTVLQPNSFGPPPEGVHAVNSTRGTVTYADGSMAKVWAAAEWTALADGVIDTAVMELVVRPIR